MSHGVVKLGSRFTGQLGRQHDHGAVDGKLSGSKVLMESVGKSTERSKAQKRGGLLLEHSAPWGERPWLGVLLSLVRWELRLGVGDEWQSV